MTSLAELPLFDGVDAPTLRDAKPRALCTDCGVSRSSDPSRCGKACQFIAPRYPELEVQVHGRMRDPHRGDEAHFGAYRRMVRARLRAPLAGAQWSGITTRLGERLLELGLVDAVIATAAQPDDRWAPMPVLVTAAEGMQACRGMKMGFSPVLALLEEAAARGYRRLAIVGVPCQVHALRALESELGLERLYVIGTPCSDNTTTARFHQFLALLDAEPQRIRYLEFLTDFTVEIRFDDGRERRIPFLNLPLRDLPPDFFPETCRVCVDYSNALADITVGYMGGEGQQWLVVRNDRGEELVALLDGELEESPLTSSGSRAGPVQSLRGALERAQGGLPLRRAPQFMRPLISWAMRRFGPKGLEFARARVEMKLVEAVLTLRRTRPRRLHRMLPASAWPLVQPYTLEPRLDERGGTS
ncbi:MAG: Coenzyme F420 hydrogenase/dehydrogenase, beta subunit C-terminal domain [Gemmatimonadales bacterium]|nr:Coenzyme F420 hydrogenase/dehydrogenase, beta subunit C-terminal domain [Gemmatimonadales bacterium]